MPELRASDTSFVLHLDDDENSMGPRWVGAVADHLETVATAGHPRPLVTIGEGKYFSTGLDLGWLLDNLDRLDEYVSSVERLLCRVLTLPVPTIAAVSGHAYGAGAMLALAHDFRLMRRDKGFFCFPEVDIEVPFSRTMASLIQAKLTPATAVASMTTGRRFAGEEARHLGLVDEVCEAELLLEAAVACVADLGGKDRETLGKIKRVMYGAVLATIAPAG
jgi:enoyl-CoA hydratase/carnithine racemase